MAIVADDTLESYLANDERQLAVERLLLRFGEALKAVPEATLRTVDPDLEWAGPTRFRDLAAHWYTEGLDHRLIWRALRNEVSRAATAIDRYLETQRSPGP